MTETRGRNFSFILYEDSAPSDWRQRLQDLHVCSAASPLHDEDRFEDDFAGDEVRPPHKAGDLKKPHRHVLLMFDGKKAVSQVCRMVEPLGVRHVELVNSLRGYSRYLCHLDEPQTGVPYPKRIYPVQGIETFCGASLDLSKALSGEELKRVRSEVIRFVRENHVTEYADLVDYAEDREPDWIEFVTGKTVFLTAYLRSVRGRDRFKSGGASE